MRSLNQSQLFKSICAGAYFGTSSVSVFRKLSVLRSLDAKPMMANCLESRLSFARLQSAGMSLRLVRSPVAPKMTMTQGDGAGFEFWWFEFMRGLWRSLQSGLGAYCFFSMWPPNWKRMAERIFDAKSFSPREVKRSYSDSVRTGAGAPDSIPAMIVQRPSPESETRPE